MDRREDTTLEEITVPEGAKLIFLPCGRYAIVDAEDYDNLSRYRWYSVVDKVKGRYYVSASINNKTTYMHRIITNAPKGMEVDHINRITHDNRRSNLRVCTPTENKRHKAQHKNSGLRFKGVFRSKSGLRFRAKITVNRVVHNLGSFTTDVEAAKAYNEAAQRFHGEFALINEIPEG